MLFTMIRNNTQMAVNLTNSNDIVANSVSLVHNDDIVHMVLIHVYKRPEVIDDIVVLSFETLNTLGN